MNEIKYCEWCNAQLKQPYYGTGRFCSRVCRGRYASSKKKIDKSGFVSARHSSKKDGWTCEVCHENFKTRALLFEHKKTHWVNGKYKKLPEAYYITKSCSFCGKLFEKTTPWVFLRHEKSCIKNPNRIHYKGHPQSEEARKKCSDSLKKAIREGRATGWHTRKRGTQSYQEKWFENVIKTRFTDKNYVSELHVGVYRLDFAWKDKMRYIEIDGSQHKQKERHESDIRKDEYCEQLGWKCLRLSCSYLLSNKEEAIKIANDFINEGIVSDKPKEWLSGAERLEKHHEELKQNGVLKDSRGQYNLNKLSEAVWKDRAEKILNSGVDLSKFGWKSEVHRKTNLSRKQINLTVMKCKIACFSK